MLSLFLTMFKLLGAGSAVDTESQLVVIEEYLVSFPEDFPSLEEDDMSELFLLSWSSSSEDDTVSLHALKPNSIAAVMPSFQKLDFFI